MAWQALQALAQSSRSLSIPGHQTWIRARDFILTIPGWPRCSSCTTHSRSGAGISTRTPHRMQFPSIVNSALFCQYGRTTSGVLSGHPLRTFFNTLLSTGSATVAEASCHSCSAHFSSAYLRKWVELYQRAARGHASAKQTYDHLR